MDAHAWHHYAERDGKIHCNHVETTDTHACQSQYEGTWTKLTPEVPQDSSGPYSIGSAKLPGLSKLVEEMGEALQVLGKLLATGGEADHWDGTNLYERLQDELSDVDAAIKFFIVYNGMIVPRHDSRVQEKFWKFVEWHNRQRDPA